MRYPTMIMALVSPLVLASTPIVIANKEGRLKLGASIYVEEYLDYNNSDCKVASECKVAPESGEKKMFINYATKLEFEGGLMISKSDELVWWITKNHPSGSGYDYYRFSFGMESVLLDIEYSVSDQFYLVDRDYD